MIESKTSERRLTARERERLAMDLRKAGATYRDIGEQLGVTPQAAYKAVMRALAKIEAKTAEAATEVLRLELERLDALLMGLWTKAANGHLGSIDRVLNIMRRRAALLGLDAPQKLEHRGKDGGPIEHKAADRVDLSGFSVPELREYRRLVEKANAGEVLDDEELRIYGGFVLRTVRPQQRE